MAGERVFNFQGNVTFNDIHDNHHCTIILPKGKTEEDAKENQEPLHTTPPVIHVEQHFHAPVGQAIAHVDSINTDRTK